jgi:hypothetical protein
MNRLFLALPLAAAMVLYCVPALASGAAILPEPMATHWLIGLMAIVIPAVRTALSNDTIKLPVWSAKYRMLLVALLAGATIVVDGLANGFTFEMALASFLANGLPSLVQEIIKLVFGAKDASGGGTMIAGGGSNTSMRPPAGPYSAKMVGLVFAVAMLVSGCAAKPLLCPLIDTAAELCPLIAVRLPDGTTEMVPREQIMGAAMGARAKRMGTALPADAGVDR